MRSFLLASTFALQLVASPAVAADLVQDRSPVAQQAGAFTGARLRVSLGGEARADRLRVGLVMAPTLRSEGSDRRSSLRFGEGVELGVVQGRPLALSIAGRPLTGRESRQLSGPKAGVSTVGWVAIGTGVVLVVGALLFFDAMNDASE